MFGVILLAALAGEVCALASGAALRLAIARLLGFRIDRASLGLGRPLWSRRRGATIWQLAPLPFGVIVQIAGLHPTADPVPADDRGAWANRGMLSRALVLLARPAGCVAFAVLVVAAGACLLGTSVPGRSAIVTQILPGRPADRAGLLAGDEILAVQDLPLGSPDELRPRIQGSSGRELALLVRRRDTQLRLVLTPEPDEHGRGRAGIAYEARNDVVRSSAGACLGEGLTVVAAFGRDLGRRLVGTGELTELKAPVAISPPRSPDAIRAELTLRLPRIVALYSLGLAVLLLLPLPFMDGGRLCALLVRGWRRRPSGVAARALGDVAIGRERLPAVVVTAATLVMLGGALLPSLGAMFSLADTAGLSAVAMAVPAVALGIALLVRWRHAWALGVFVPFSLVPSLPDLRMPPGLMLGSVACLVAAPLLLTTDAARRALGQRCPACGKTRGRPVLSAPEVRCCLHCGSTWRPRRERTRDAATAA